MLSMPLALFITLLLHADPVISLFFRPLSLQEEPEKLEAFSKRWAEPARIERYQLRFSAERALLGSHTAGIPCLYAGFIAFSNANGQVLFPRLQEKEEMYVLITDAIETVMMTDTIVHHLRIPERAHAVLYHLTLFDPDETVESYAYWNITQENHQEHLLENGKIPDKTVIVIAKPKNVFYPEKQVITLETANLTLPNLYVRKTIDTITNALYILDFKQFFRHIHPFSKVSATRIIELLPSVD